MGTVFGIALRNLMQAKRRTLLIGVAVVIVAALYLVLKTVSYSTSQRMIESATTLSAGHVNVGGFFKLRKKGSDPILAYRHELREAVAELVPEALSIIDRHRGWGRLIGPSSSINVGISGIVYEEETRFFNSLRIAKPSEYSGEDGAEVPGDLSLMKEPGHVLLFAAQAKKLGVRPGDSMTVVTEVSGGQPNTVDLKVAAVASDIGLMSNWNIFVPRQTILDLYRAGENTTGVIMVYLSSPDRANAVMERLRKGLVDKGYNIMDHDPNPFFMKFEKVAGEDWLGQKLDLTIWSDEISFVLWITTALDMVAFFVVGVLALIIAGGLMNAIWMNVRERTKEIGTMRAIGVQKNFVVRLFVIESIALGFLASMVGTAVAIAFILFINSLGIPISNDGARLFLLTNTLAFDISWPQVVSTWLLFAGVTGLAALYPALRASALRPVEALIQSA